jgi:protein-tyrosine phosphatase
VIDLHFHCLPGLDDGPKDVEAAVMLARAAASEGTEAVVATPHVSWDWPNRAENIGSALRQLTAALAAQSVPLRVYPGAEIALTAAYELTDSELRTLRLGAGPWLLIEPPHAPGVTAVEGMLNGLRERGHPIVLAHVERCPAFLDDAGLLGRLVHGGMLASITAGSLAGRFGRSARRAAQRFMADGLIHNVASDAHDCVRRPPGVLRELSAEGLTAQASWLTLRVPEAILRGSAIPPAPH